VKREGENEHRVRSTREDNQILIHYFKRIGEASGLHWSQKTKADMEALAALLCNDLREALPAPIEERDEEQPPMSDREWMR
jgi:hypothetical protein